jgi:FtsZ-interacting cell division protein YlmF
MEKRERLAVILTVLVETLIYKVISKEIYIGVKGRKAEDTQDIIFFDQGFKFQGKNNGITEDRPKNHKKRRNLESNEKIVPIFSTEETLARTFKAVEIKESKDYLECKFVVNRVRSEKCKLINLSLQRLLKF